MIYDVFEELDSNQRCLFRILKRCMNTSYVQPQQTDSIHTVWQFKKLLECQFVTVWTVIQRRAEKQTYYQVEVGGRDAVGFGDEDVKCSNLDPEVGYGI